MTSNSLVERILDAIAPWGMLTVLALLLLLLLLIAATAAAVLVVSLFDWIVNGNPCALRTCITVTIGG